MMSLVPWMNRDRLWVRISTTGSLSMKFIPAIESQKPIITLGCILFRELRQDYAIIQGGINYEYKREELYKSG